MVYYSVLYYGILTVLRADNNLEGYGNQSNIILEKYES